MLKVLSGFILKYAIKVLGHCYVKLAGQNLSHFGGRKTHLGFPQIFAFDRCSHLVFGGKELNFLKLNVPGLLIGNIVTSEL